MVESGVVVELDNMDVDEFIASEVVKNEVADDIEVDCVGADGAD